VKRVNVRWLWLRPPDQLDDDEHNALDEILSDDDRLNAGYQLLQWFRRLIARPSVRDLDQWLEDAAASGPAPSSASPTVFRRTTLRLSMD
jgi:transposase